MGILDSLIRSGAAAYDGMQKNAAEIQKIKEQLQYHSDDQLFQELRTGSYQRKMTYSLLLQKRGYSKDQIASGNNG